MFYCVKRDLMFLFTLKKKKVSYCFPWGLRTELVEAVLKFRATGVGGSGMQELACTCL